MNILQINTLDNIGGAAKVSYRLYKQFKKSGHKSYLLVGRKRIKDKNIVEIKREAENKFKTYLIRKFGLEEFFSFQNKEIIKNKFFKLAQIVNLHNLHGNYFNLSDLIEISNLRKTIWTMHDMWPITGHCAHSFDCQKWQKGCHNCPHLETYPVLKYDLANFLWKKKKKIYSQSNFTIVVPSKWLMRKVQKSFLKNKRVELIYNAVDNQIFKPREKKKIRQILKLPLNKKIILFTAQGGIGNRWKGKEYLLQLKEKIQKEKNIMFLEIGSAIKEKGKNFLRTPYIKNEYLLSKYYNAADIFIFTSLAENCPLVVLEAMACGLPVISFDVGGVKELVEHEKTGYIARYKNMPDLIRGVELFLSNKNFLRKSSLRTRKRVEKFFTLNIQTKKYLKLYSDLLKNKNL